MDLRATTRNLRTLRLGATSDEQRVPQAHESARSQCGMVSADRDKGRDAGGTSSFTKASSALGLTAAFALAVLGNVVVARNYKRWDLTSNKMYSLSSATKETLHGLQETVQINVLVTESDPLQVSIRHILESYRSETTRLDIRYIDPDRKPAEFLEFKQKYNLQVGRTEEGRVVADAILVVVKGDRRWFLTHDDLVDLSEDNEGRSRPKLEQGLTLAIRNVLGGERRKVCFSKGHGELGADEPGARGLGELKYRLERNNVDTSVVDLSLVDLNNEKNQPWKDCSLVLLAGPQVPFSDREAKTLSLYFEGGGNLFFLVNPMLDTDKKRVVASGLETVMALGGIEAHGDVIFEQDKLFRVPGSMGETFLGQPRPHPVTDALLKMERPRLIFILAQSLGRVASSSVQPVDLIGTSKEAFSLTDFLSWSSESGPPEKRPGDRAGELTVAMASELPKKEATAPHGPRMLVVGSASIVQGQVWQEPSLRPSAYFVESAISWLTSRPQLVDIPEKSAEMAGLRLTEDSLSQVTNYVSFYIPLAGAFLGLAVFLRRRSTERRRDAHLRTRDGEKG